MKLGNSLFNVNVNPPEQILKKETCVDYLFLSLQHRNKISLLKECFIIQAKPKYNVDSKARHRQQFLIFPKIFL